METPVRNIVDSVDVTPSDALLPLFECVGNSIIGLQQIDCDLNDKWIEIELIRGDPPKQASLIDGSDTIRNIVVKDNGIGFTSNHYGSFGTPFSKVNRNFGCLGMGRFTVIAIYERMEVQSNFLENDKWQLRKFTFDATNEVRDHELSGSDQESRETAVTLRNCFRDDILDRTGKSLEEIARQVMSHFLIYYLNGDLPPTKITDSKSGETIVLSDLYSEVSKERERDFTVGDHNFRTYLTKTPKKGARRLHYVHYCANSRVVGGGRDLSKISSLFSYPIVDNGNQYCLDAFVVSDYLNRKVFKTRNGFNISKEKDGLLSGENSEPSFQEIDAAVAGMLENEYSEFVRETRERSVQELKEYIIEKAPRFNSFLRNEEILKSIPANLPDEKKEEHLYRIAHRERERVERKLEDIIANKQINEETIAQVVAELRTKSAHDKDSLADYLMRRKAILDLFDKYLEADREGKYKLEEDIHSLIFPMGLTGDDVNYETHNLWILDERFVTYSFIGSDVAIGSISQKKSRKAPDVVAINNNNDLFGNPISFGDKPHGEINSLVIFEFKRPGEVAHQKNKGNYRWDFAELTSKYFDDFMYAPDKVKHKGRPVIVGAETPKFGYIIVDVIPKQLEEYNVNSKGWNKTPFGTFFWINPKTNLHLGY
ncbi:MAG: hypothetical protein WBD27_15580 [Pyrinomonadaceae bacterium]